MKTLKELLKVGIEILEKSGIEEAGLDAWLLLEYETGKNRAYFYAHPEETVTEETANAYLEKIRCRATHIPLQHITHQAFFMGYGFYVDENVLVPRQDTETLVEKALEIAASMENPEIMDMCTGSGCILLSLLLERKDSTGTGVDVSSGALKVAEKNAKALGVTDRVSFVESNLFSAFFLQKKDGKTLPGYDMLISNPPYIRTADIDTLMEEVQFHDPRIALDGHEDGLYFYRKITVEGKTFLKPGGWLLYEIGYDQGNEVGTIMRKAGFSHVEIIKDLAGQDRVALGQLTEKKQEENHV